MVLADAESTAREKEMRDGKEEPDQCAVRLQLHQGRLPLQPVHLRELQLLS